MAHYMLTRASAGGRWTRLRRAAKHIGMAVHSDDKNAKRPRRNKSGCWVALEPIAPHSDPDGPIVALLDQLGGAGQGPTLLRRLRDPEQPPRLIAQSIAASPAFEWLYKQSRTSTSE